MTLSSPLDCVIDSACAPATPILDIHYVLVLITAPRAAAPLFIDGP